MNADFLSSEGRSRLVRASGEPTAGLASTADVPNQKAIVAFGRRIDIGPSNPDRLIVSRDWIVTSN